MGYIVQKETRILLTRSQCEIVDYDVRHVLLQGHLNLDDMQKIMIPHIVTRNFTTDDIDSHACQKDSYP